MYKDFDWLFVRLFARALEAWLC